MYLVDTDVISGGAPTKGLRNAAVAAWMDRNSDQLFISAITVAEITDGIEKSRRESATRKAAALEEWLQALFHLYGHRILSFDLSAAVAAGKLSDRARAIGCRPGFADLAIAATAAVHDLIVLTHNVRHFASLEVPARDPLDIISQAE